MDRQLKQTIRVLSIALACLFVQAVALAQVTFTEYPGPTTPTFESGYTMVDITTGPDGNLWFTENYAFGVQTQIGRITPSGGTYYYSVPSGSSEKGICAGPDGNLWFTEYRTARIGRVSPDGTFDEFPCGSHPSDITAGPDGNLWYTTLVSNTIGEITPDGTMTTEFPVPTRGSDGYGAIGIAAGPDGNLWYTTPSADIVGKCTPLGDFTEYQLPASSYPYGIAAGPDGNLWFTEFYGNNIGRITTAGVITEFPVSTDGIHPTYITVGPDSNLWFTSEYGVNNIGRITTAGVITEFAIPTSSECGGITTGPDGNLWFLESTANKIVKAIIKSTIRSLSPNSTSTGGPAFTLTLKGINFASNSIVKWTQGTTTTALTTTYVSTTQLKAVAPASLISAPGNATLAVVTGAIRSNSKTFTIRATTLKLTGAQMSKDANGNYVVTLTLKNVGYQTASSVKITTSTLAAAATSTALPVNMGNTAAGSTATTTLTYPASAGSSGSVVPLKVFGTFTGGTFSGSLKVTLP